MDTAPLAPQIDLSAVLAPTPVPEVKPRCFTPPELVPDARVADWRAAFVSDTGPNASAQDIAAANAAIRITL